MFYLFVNPLVFIKQILKIKASFTYIILISFDDLDESGIKWVTTIKEESRLWIYHVLLLDGLKLILFC